jgi:hypothetical protein
MFQNMLNLVEHPNPLLIFLSTPWDMSEIRLYRL